MGSNLPSAGSTQSKSSFCSLFHPPIVTQQPCIQRDQLNVETGHSVTSPTSPRYDDISTLPTPVISEASPMALSTPLLPSLPSSPPRAHTSQSRPKNYGTLTTRPGPTDDQAMEHQRSRILSEYGSSNTMDIFASAGKSVLDPRMNAQKRNISTPLAETWQNDLEREQMRVDTPPRLVNPSDVYTGVDSTRVQHTWRKVRLLGKGTFSTVLLGKIVNEANASAELQLVAIKVVMLPQHRESRKRIESSLMREMEILRFLKHPCTTKLLAADITSDRCCLITPYCEGTDLFELAARYRNELSPLLIRRIFGEVAVAVAYLHKNNIVHRDIKLENVLVNIRLEKLIQTQFQLDDQPIIRLTDFGLSRIIDPSDPLLVTRCGSEDYVPPELLVGVPYDGRQSDAWALGVLLYAIMESRLPFDPPVTKSIRAKSRVSHRIARIEWAWNKFGNESVEEWNHNDWDGAKWIVEHLLIRREHRISTLDIVDHPWVSGVLPKGLALDNF